MNIRHLEKFLINRGLLEAFIRNFKKDNRRQDYGNFIRFNSKSMSAIANAFYWSSTFEGADFWSKIDKEWNNCLRKNLL